MEPKIEYLFKYCPHDGHPHLAPLSAFPRNVNGAGGRANECSAFRTEPRTGLPQPIEGILLRHAPVADEAVMAR